MTHPRHLSNPPVTEAVIDFVFYRSIDEDGVRSLAKAVRDVRKGWELTEFGHVETTVNVTSGETYKQSRAFEGMRLSGDSGRIIIQYRCDRVTVSHVGSYSEWEALANDAMVAAVAFAESAGDAQIKRTGVRFVNVLSLKNSVTDLLRSPPKPIRDGWTLTDYWDRQVFKDSSQHSISVTLATVAQRPMAEEGPGQKVLLFDIDVAKDCSVELESEEMASALQDLRDVKNAVFFGSLQEAALEAYK